MADLQGDDAPGSALGDRIRQRRLELRMTQTELARRCGISGAALSDLEGKVSDCSPHLSGLAFALGVSVQWLAEGIGEKHSAAAVETAQEEMPSSDIMTLARKLAQLPDAKLQALGVLLDIELFGK